MPESHESSQSLVLPNLFIPGAAKSATTSLHDYLGQHPSIYMSAVKEPQFFSHDSNYDQGLSLYSRLFLPGKNLPVRGESSPVYMVSGKAIERIRRDIGEPKFIFILRNPVDRAWSHYWWLKAMCYETKAFRDAFVRDMNDEPVAEMFSDMETSKFYYQIGCYGKWLTGYIDAFDRKNILIVTTERLKRNTMVTLNTCTAFLGLPPFTTIRERMSNRTVVCKYPSLLKLWMNLGGRYRKWLASRLPVFIVKPVREFRETTAFRIMGIQEPRPLMSRMDRNWIASYYREDVAKLRRLTSMSFTEWSSDFPAHG